MSITQQSNQPLAGIELRGVKKSFGAIDVIHGVDLTVSGGEFVVFVGPSGCGKSTLLRMISGLEDVSDGEIHIGGRDVTELDPSKRGIAMVFQSYALYPHMSVRKNLAFGLKVAGTPKAEMDRQIATAAEILKIEPLLDRKPRQLSGGQRQRVAIGRAIVRKPQVFLFDEPLSNLDAELRVSMRIEIARLHRELGNTMVYVTHDQTEAMTLADKIVVLRAGRIEQIGTPEEIYENPSNEFVAGFIGSPRMNITGARFLPDGRVEAGGSRITPAAPIPTAHAGESIKLGIRPEHIVLGGEGDNAIRAKVDFTEYLGSNGYLYCTNASGEAMIAELREGTKPRAGDLVWLTYEPSKLRFFTAGGERLRLSGE